MFRMNVGYRSFVIFVILVTQVRRNEALETRFPDPKARVAAARQERTEFLNFRETSTPEQGEISKLNRNGTLSPPHTCGKNSAKSLARQLAQLFP